MYGANTSGIILGTIILDSSQRIFLKLIAEETEEDVERNENICRQTDNQSSKVWIQKLRPPYPLWSVDSRGAGQYWSKTCSPYLGSKLLKKPFHCLNHPKTISKSSIAQKRFSLISNRLYQLTNNNSESHSSLLSGTAVHVQ